MGGDVVAYAALANRGFCKRENSDINSKSNCKLPSNIPFFALADFTFEMYTPQDCPMCKDGKSNAIKPGSRGN
jgi:orotate phosphoribosyltransferase